MDMTRMRFNGYHIAGLSLVAAGVAVGSFAAGHYVGRRSAAEEFGSRLDHEVEVLKARYANMRDEAVNEAITRIYGSPVPLEPDDNPGMEGEGQAAVGGDDEAGDNGVVDDSAVAAGDEHEGSEQVLPGENSLPDLDTRASTGKPFPISLSEFCDPPAGYQQITLTYYSADRVLVDDKEQPVNNIVKIVGPLNSPLDFGGISEDPHLRYVRNPKAEADFEIILNTGSYSEYIMNYRRIQ
jgi:hypothetical protein